MQEVNMYQLIAINEQGASVEIKGNSKSELLKDFDNEYERSGYKITVYTPENEEIEIKKTYR
jgi:hypothetical protein